MVFPEKKITRLWALKNLTRQFYTQVALEQEKKILGIAIIVMRIRPPFFNCKFQKKKFPLLCFNVQEEYLVRDKRASGTAREMAEGIIKP